MSDAFRSSRDIIVRTEDWEKAKAFYGTTLGLPISYESSALIGFETGSFCLYVEKGKAHGPVFEFFVDDVQRTKAQLVAAGCVVQDEDAAVPRCYMRDPHGLVFNLRPGAAVG
jgi:predicted enzyme related to lactoylglutathione lyase